MRNSKKIVNILLACSLCWLMGQPAKAQEVSGKDYRPIMVEAKPWVKNKDTEWRTFETRVIDRMTAFTPVESYKVNRYGSDESVKDQATGFFYVKQEDGRWWMIDPDGCRHLDMAVVSVRCGQGEQNKKAFARKFSNERQWMDATAEMLFGYGFAGSASWSDEEAVRSYNKRAVRPMTHSVMLNFMASYGRKRGGTYQLPGNTGYPNQTIFVFDPEFKEFCDEYASQVARYKDDATLIGYFSDNEMPLGMKNLEGYLTLPKADDPGRLAAEKWLADKGIDRTQITEEHRAEFAGYVAETYFRIVSQALKKYDPNHMYLGSRLHGSNKFLKQVVEAAGRYCDVVSINYYGHWTPSTEAMANWGRWAGKPFMITEFYTKGMDSGLKNDTGAGFCVRTQLDRGRAYQHFVLGLLESGNCVGWHWFKYQDNDPTAKGVDPSNLNSNKGLVDNNYEPYADLAALMKQLNVNAYRLADYFDSRKADEKPLYILLGQSNMAGRAPVEGADLDTLEHVFLFNDKGRFEKATNPLNRYSNIRKSLDMQKLGPGYSFARTVAAAHGGDDIYLLVNARGGVAISEFMKGSESGYYEKTLQRIRQALDSCPGLKPAAIIWHQGESDAQNVHYVDDLKTLIEDYREALGIPDLPLVMGEIWRKPNGSTDAFLKRIQEVPKKIPHSGLVSAEGTSTIDGTHFDAASQKLLGERYARKLQELEK